jgi:hypothetical protein
MTQAYLDLLEAALAPTRVAVRKPIALAPRGVPGAERSYERALIAWNRSLVRMVVKELKPVMATARNDSRLDATIDVGRLLQALARIRRRLPGLVGSAIPAVQKALTKLNRDNYRDVSRVLPISISEQGPEVEGITGAWRAENVRLISTIGTRLLDDLWDARRDAPEKNHGALWRL